jgi:hypothetical protein
LQVFSPARVATWRAFEVPWRHRPSAAIGTAHLNIARTYYLVGERGDYRYELALDAFADAIVADPLTYGPRVISSLREFGYTWKEDLDEITQRVERKRAALLATVRKKTDEQMNK